MTPSAHRLRLVVPRYGAEVSGGSELLVRRLARALCDRSWDVEVWTTTAIDEATWSAGFPVGETDDGGVKVRRFPVSRRRPPRLFHQMSRALFRLPPVLRPEAAWLAVQGPYAPDLVRALARDTDRASLFMPYLYHPTIRGMPVAAHPACSSPPPTTSQHCVCAWSDGRWPPPTPSRTPRRSAPYRNRRTRSPRGGPTPWGRWPSTRPLASTGRASAAATAWDATSSRRPHARKGD